MSAVEPVTAPIAGYEPDETIRVFICDDDADVRMLLRLRLERDPHVSVVGEAADGAAALEGIAATHPDVAVLDMVMPRLSGFEVIERLRSLAPDVRPIVLSATVGERTSRIARAAGSVACLPKPAGLRSVLPAIREAAGRAA